MATYRPIVRASDNMKDRLDEIANQWNQEYQADGETASIVRSGYAGHKSYSLHLQYDDGGSAELGLWLCECGEILTDGGIEAEQCAGCWQRWDD